LFLHKAFKQISDDKAWMALSPDTIPFFDAVFPPIPKLWIRRWCTLLERSAD